MKKIYVIDGNSLLFRAFYATSYGDVTSIMRTKDGIPTNAIFAFGNMLSKLLGSVELGDGFFVGFDADSKTFRKAEFEQPMTSAEPSPKRRPSKGIKSRSTQATKTTFNSSMTASPSI